MKRTFPYINLRKVGGKAFVCVAVDHYNYGRRFPLNFEGCRAAGRYLFSLGAETWMYSSSADFPTETLPGFRGDVRALIDEGFEQEEEKANAVRSRVIAKVLTYCSCDQFQKTLTEAEREVFAKIKGGQ